MSLLAEKSILVVDDEEDIRDILREGFEMDGATTWGASNGSVAIEMLQKNHFDVVITDMRMPNGNGLEVIKKVKAMDLKNTKVFLCSGYSDVTEEESYKLGVSAVFSKPFNTDEIISVIISVLNKKTISGAQLGFASRAVPQPNRNDSDSANNFKPDAYKQDTQFLHDLATPLAIAKILANKISKELKEEVSLDASTASADDKSKQMDRIDKLIIHLEKMEELHAKHKQVLLGRKTN